MCVQTIKNANIDVDVRIRAGSIIDFILWRDDLRFRRWEHTEVDLNDIQAISMDYAVLKLTLEYMF